MKQFSLNRLIITNFRSIREACVDFSNSVGLKLLLGDNQVESRLGGNGSGKSSIWQALNWCLHGTGVKGERTSSLLTWGQSQVEVLTEVSINNVIYSIYRCGPPMKIEVNGSTYTQAQLDELLGFNKEKFQHCVLFGQGVPLFADRSIPERGELLDDVLQLDVWNKASKNATDKYTKLEKDVAKKKTDLAFTEGQLTQLETQEYIQGQIEYWDETHGYEIASITSKHKAWDEQRTIDLSALDVQVNQWQNDKEQELRDRISEASNCESELELLRAQLCTIPKIDFAQVEVKVKTNEELLTRLRREYTELDTERKLKTAPRDFWMKNSLCPTCLQDITEEQKHEHLCVIDQEEQILTGKLDHLTEGIEKAKTEVEQSRQALKFLVSTSSQNAEQLRNIERNIKNLEIQLEGIASSAEKVAIEVEQNKNPFKKQYAKMLIEVNPYEFQLATLKKKVNPYIDLLEKNKQDRQTLQSKQDQQSTEIKQVQQSLVSVEYWKHGFKRIRLFFVNKILAALEIEIHSALSTLGLENWAITLSTESLTKSETVKLGVQIQIKSPTAQGEWTSWSGGESQRLRLAIEMGLASLIQRAAGCFWNLEIWDEPGQHLSEQGMEDLLETLKYRAESTNKSIFITHHSALIYSGFSEIWKVTKDNLGSRINVISGDQNYV